MPTRADAGDDVDPASAATPPAPGQLADGSAPAGGPAREPAQACAGGAAPRSAIREARLRPNSTMSSS